MLAARQGDAERSLTETRQAVELVDQTDLIVYRADAYRVLAEVLLSAGRPQEAEEAAERSLELSEAKENVAAASRVRSLLATLEAEAEA